jgi:pSer/pThr/pTyr-binding forkhead associated (FHA) protein
MSPEELAAESAPAPTPALPPEEVTKPHKLAEQVDRHNKKRRRALSGEVRMTRPGGAEVRLPLERSETIIGRDPKCDIVLGEESVSRRHASIGLTDEGFFELVDLRSKNGVIVEGSRVSRMTLLDGDEFEIGDTKFAIAIGSKPETGSGR